MNSCGQHGLANIGFHGSSIKHGANVVPALQVLLGGGTVGNGEGRAAEKVIKVPSKRGLDVVRCVLNDFEANAAENEYFNSYYDRQGKNYFYQLLKPLADLTTLTQDEYMDWGHVESFATAIGVGECAGVMIDLIATLIYEAEEKLDLAIETYENRQYADSIYHSYSVFVHTAKALLLSKDVNCNTHIGIINDFTTHFAEESIFQFEPDFKTVVLQINQNEPTQEFAVRFLSQAKDFVQAAKEFREAEQQAAALPVNLLNLNK
jgi:sulfite reductase (ferredoxin)